MNKIELESSANKLDLKQEKKEESKEKSGNSPMTLYEFEPDEEPVDPSLRQDSTSVLDLLNQ